MPKFKIFCADCETGYEGIFVARPALCRNCGSDFIASKEFDAVLTDDVIARLRKLKQDGFTDQNLCVAFKVDEATLSAVLNGEYGEGKLTPHYVSVSDRVAFWIAEQRKRKVLP